MLYGAKSSPDGFALVKGGTWSDDDEDGNVDAGEMTAFDTIDWIGNWDGDPGSAWDVCGNGDTKDNTLVRMSSVTAGSDWSVSSNADTCEWEVYPNNTWDYVGSHPHEFEPECEFFDCMGVCAEGYESWVGDGYCDDGSWGYYFDCAEFDCDAGDCLVECWDGSSACGSAACPEQPTCTAGDVNGDDVVNVSDIVVLVNFILGGGTGAVDCGDLNDDGVTNVSDIVQVVNYILGGGTASVHINEKATQARLELSNDNLSVDAEGCVQGVEMTLSHDNDIEISLVDADCMHCYSASNQIDANTTKIVVVRAGAECVTDLGSIVGDYDISGLVMSNHQGQTIDSDWYEYSDFKVEIAGPNPFNPSTALNVVVPADGYVSVKIYNLIGQEVATLQDGYMDQNFNGYKLNWNASNLASGVYLVRAESAGTVSLNKLMLLK